MNPYLAVAALVFLVSLMFMLPLIPALVELRRKSDALPLSVVQQNAEKSVTLPIAFETTSKGLNPPCRAAWPTGLRLPARLPTARNMLCWAGPMNRCCLRSSSATRLIRW